MRHIKRGVFVISLMVMLTGCWFPPGAPPPPTRGPVGVRSGKRGIISTELTLSTNCLAVGETVVIQGMVKNEASYPLQFKGTPAFDFILRPGDWDPSAGSAPIRRWSETPDYPAINSTLAPGEMRTYEWHWQVEPAYARRGLKGISGFVVQFWQGAMEPEGIPAGGQEAGAGVGGLPAPESTYSFIPCNELDAHTDPIIY